MPIHSRIGRVPIRCIAVAVAALVIAASALPLSADDDHDRAREAVRSGRVLSLEAVLVAMRAEFAGQVLDVELEEEDGAMVYEIELLTPDGRKIELEYEAGTGRLLSVAGPGVAAGERGGEDRAGGG